MIYDGCLAFERKLPIIHLDTNKQKYVQCMRGIQTGLRCEVVIFLQGQEGSALSKNESKFKAKLASILKTNYSLQKFDHMARIAANRISHRNRQPRCG